MDEIDNKILSILEKSKKKKTTRLVIISKKDLIFDLLEKGFTCKEIYNAFKAVKFVNCTYENFNYTVKKYILNNKKSKKDILRKKLQNNNDINTKLKQDKKISLSNFFDNINKPVEKNTDTEKEM